MHVAVVVRKFARTGGVERYADALMRRLVRDGHAVTLVCARADTPPPDGVAVIRAGRLGAGETLKNLAFARAAGAVTAPGRFDVSITLSRSVGQDVMRAGHGTHEGYSRAMFAAGLPAEKGLLGRALHSIEARQFGDPRLKRAIAISNRVKGEIVSIHGVDPAKVEVIYNGVDTARFGRVSRAAARTALGVEDDAFVVAFVGSGFARKGLGFLIDAMPLIRTTAAKTLLVAGADAHAGEYAERARRLGVGGTVRLLGPREDVETVYAAADVAALPSVYEPFGNTVLEAMASGIPVVASAACGASEIFPADLAHLVVADPSDTAALAAAVGRYADPGASARDGARCRKVAGEHPLEGALGKVTTVIQAVGRVPQADGARLTADG